MSYEDAGLEVLRAKRDKARQLQDAAPELLAALQQIAAIKNEMHGGDWDEIEAARLIAIAAIAKATGADK